jgi:hypothetical protein
MARVTRRGQAVHRVLRASVRRTDNTRSVGALAWRDLMAIVDDAARSPMLTRSERRVAQHTVRWMKERLAQRDVYQRRA